MYLAPELIKKAKSCKFIPIGTEGIFQYEEDARITVDLSIVDYTSDLLFYTEITLQMCNIVLEELEKQKLA